MHETYYLAVEYARVLDSATVVCNAAMNFAGKDLQTKLQGFEDAKRTLLTLNPKNDPKLEEFIRKQIDALQHISRKIQPQSNRTDP